MADNTVETSLLEQVIEAIPIKALQKPVEDLVTMCGKKGNTKY